MDLLNRAKKLKAEGKSYEQIGKALGITKSAAYRLLQNQTENVADSDFDDDFDTETVEKSQNKSISSKNRTKNRS